MDGSAPALDCAPDAGSGTRAGDRQPSATTRWTSRRTLWSCAATALLLFFLAVNLPLLRGRAAPLWDAHIFYGPYYILVADYARAGRLLLWNPWSNGGSPDFAEPQVGAFSPVMVAFGALTGGTPDGFVYYWLSVWFMAGVSMLLLGWHLGAPPWGASVVALGFVFSGFFVGHAEHTSFLHSMAWLPFVIWRLDVAVLSGRIRPAIEAGVLWGLSALAGYPGLTALNGGFAFIWAAGRALCRDDQGEGMNTPARRLLVGNAVRSIVTLLVVGILVMSPAYVGLLVEGAGFSERAHPLPRETAIGSNALHPRALATVFSPYLGSLDGRRLWPYTDISSTSVYMGAAVLWIALAGLVMRPGSGWRWWLCGSAVLALALSLGQVLPLRGWLYDLVPPTRYFRHAAIYRAYAIFSLSVLALAASTDLADRLGAWSRRTRWAVALSAAVLALLAVVLACAVLGAGAEPNDPWRRLIGRLHLGTVWLGVVGAGIAAGVLTSRQRAALMPGLLVALAVVDAVGAHRLPATLYARDVATVESWRSLEAGHAPDLELTGEGTRRVLAVEGADAGQVSSRNLAFKRAVFVAYAPFSNRFHQAWASDHVLREAATGDSRFWFAQDVARVPPSSGAFRAFRARAAAMGAPPVVIHSPEALVNALASGPRPRRRDAGDTPGPAEPSPRVAVSALPAATRIPVALERYRPEELVFAADVPGDGWLLVTDRWARGWRATVNGQPVAVAPANFIFRAVPVTAGHNRIMFTYHPFGFPWLLIVSWGMIAAAGATAIACWVHRHARIAVPAGARPSCS